MNKTLYLLLAVLLMICTQSELSAQCHPDQHSTNWYDGWASCEKSISPNPERGNKHWIMYDLKEVYALGGTKIWNINDPKHLDWGVRKIYVDISTDGENWTEVGEFTIGQAPGLNQYEGEEGPNLEGFDGRYVLITAKNNYGGECFGFSEIRIEAQETSIISSTSDLNENQCLKVSAFPNPFVERFEILFNAQCPGEVTFELIDILGKQVISGQRDLHFGENKVHVNLEDVPVGSYFLNVRQGVDQLQVKVVKMNRT